VALHERLAPTETSALEAAGALARAQADAKQSEAQARELQANVDTMRETRAWRLATGYWRLKRHFG
jgi:hypothetical protein